MAGEIHKCIVVGANNSYKEESIHVPGIAAAEEDHWSPTQQEVDTYIDSLEQELLRSCEGMPNRLGNRNKRAAPIKDRLSNSFTLSWVLGAIAAGCFWELARIILKALN